MGVFSHTPVTSERDVSPPIDVPKPEYFMVACHMAGLGPSQAEAGPSWTGLGRAGSGLVQARTGHVIEPQLGPN